MPGGAKGDIKFGFYLGLGLVAATLVVGLLQLLALRAVAKRNG